MEYRCISADCHIDLNWLPHDVFTKNATAAMKERMPYVVQDKDGPRWMTKQGLNLGLANGKGGTGAVGSGRKYYAGTEHRLDRMASTGLFADSEKDIFRPGRPELRIQDQERDGIQAEVIYGLLGSANKIKDREVALEFHRIYNDWLADFCQFDRKRFVGLASIPTHTVELAVAEARRVAKLGLGGLDVTATYDMTPFWSPYWDPLWKAAADTNLAVHFHTIGPRPEPPLPPETPDILKMASKATRTASFQLFMASILGAVIHGGALDRFPNLKVVLGESGIGWLPYVLYRMDYEWEGRYGSLCKERPSFYWRRQCRATFQNDPVGCENLERIGVETVMWGSDYPHPDGVFPDSQEFIQRQFGHLPADIKRKIICENVGKFYGLM
jgi:predicted TIM-barrel fold metal-dependent hydrolase